MACLWKQHWSYWRNPHYNVVRFFFTTVVALLFGTIFWDLGTKRSEYLLQNWKPPQFHILFYLLLISLFPSTCLKSTESLTVMTLSKLKSKFSQTIYYWRWGQIICWSLNCSLLWLKYDLGSTVGWYLPSYICRFTALACYLFWNLLGLLLPKNTSLPNRYPLPKQ